MTTPQQPPGWYPDPWMPGGTRWWDGNHWGPPAGPPPGGYRPLVDLDDERRNGDRVRGALIAGMAAYVLQMIAQVIYLTAFAKEFRRLFDQPVGRGQTTLAFQLDPTAQVASLLVNLASLVLLVVGILFLIWFHRALTNAQNLGLPLRRSPGWGVAGFLIPIVNFWFPYQSACDLFGPDRPERKLVLRWWLTWLSGGFLIFGVLVGAFIDFAVAGAFGAAAAACYVAAGLAAREMIRKAHERHVELVAGAPSGVYGPHAMPYGTAPPSGPQPPLPGSPPPRASDPWGNPL